MLGHSTAHLHDFLVRQDAATGASQETLERVDQFESCIRQVAQQACSATAHSAAYPPQQQWTQLSNLQLSSCAAPRGAFGVPLSHLLQGAGVLVVNAPVTDKAVSDAAHEMWSAREG